VPTADVLTGITIAGVGGTMPKYSGTKYTPTASGILIPAGYHDGTTGTVADPDLVAANILSGKSIFGVVGNVQPKNYASGTATSSGATYKTFTKSSGGTTSTSYVQVSGLTFQPSFILCYQSTYPPYMDNLTYSLVLPNANAKFNETNGYVLFTGSTNTTYQIDGTSIYVNATGFEIISPTYANQVFWQAWS